MRRRITEMKFYKITNKEEIHNGLQYKTGLNIDPLPFSTEKPCSPGGIYFAREYILEFLEPYAWIREVTIPPTAEVFKEVPLKVEKWKASKVILGERRLITLNVIKELVEEGAIVDTPHGTPLSYALWSDDLDMMAFFLEKGAYLSIGVRQWLQRFLETGKGRMTKELLSIIGREKKYHKLIIEALCNNWLNTYSETQSYTTMRLVLSSIPIEIRDVWPVIPRVLIYSPLFIKLFFRYILHKIEDVEEILKDVTLNGWQPIETINALQDVLSRDIYLEHYKKHMPLYNEESGEEL